MLRASTSIPWASLAAMRVAVLSISRPGASSGWLMMAAAAGTMQWAWMSMVLTRLPATTVSRRRGWSAGGDVAVVIPQPMKAIPAMAVASKSPVIVMCFPPGLSVLSVPQHGRCRDRRAASDMLADTGDEDKPGTGQHDTPGHHHRHQISPGCVAQQAGDLWCHVAGDIADRVDEGNSAGRGPGAEIGCRQVPEHRQAGRDPECRHAEGADGQIDVAKQQTGGDGPRSSHSDRNHDVPDALPTAIRTAREQDHAYGTADVGQYQHVADGGVGQAKRLDDQRQEEGHRVDAIGHEAICQCQHQDLRA